jgi:threonine/homoserine/homoserine lactone efflux protein
VPLPLAFVVTALVVELTPGPNMGYLAILSAREGRRAGLAAVLGIALGLLIVGLAASLGLTAIISTSRWLYEALRWAGALYLLWLAWEGWRGEAEVARLTERNAVSEHSRFFIRGLTTNLLNPKAGIFYVATLPSFVNAAEPALPQVLLMTCAYVAIATVVHATLVLLAGMAQAWLRNGRRSRLVRRALSLLLVAIAVWLLGTTSYSGR